MQNDREGGAKCDTEGSSFGTKGAREMLQKVCRRSWYWVSLSPHLPVLTANTTSLGAAHHIAMPVTRHKGVYKGKPVATFKILYRSRGMDNMN